MIYSGIHVHKYPWPADCSENKTDEVTSQSSRLRFSFDFSAMFERRRNLSAHSHILQLHLLNVLVLRSLQPKKLTLSAWEESLEKVVQPIGWKRRKIKTTRLSVTKFFERLSAFTWLNVILFSESTYRLELCVTESRAIFYPFVQLESCCHLLHLASNFCTSVIIRSSVSSATTTQSCVDLDFSPHTSHSAERFTHNTTIKKTTKPNCINNMRKSRIEQNYKSCSFQYAIRSW